MFSENLVSMRKLNKLSQESLAEKVGVSRQTIAKWEAGEGLPDIERCQKLAESFHVSLDDLVNYDLKEEILPIPPKGNHIFGLVKVGEKGQIVIPAKARKIFNINPGDELLVLGDESQGIALLRSDYFTSLMEQIQKNEEK